MPFKDAEARRINRRKWYKINVESAVEAVKKRKLKVKKWFNDYKKELKCSICSENHPAAIDFHHRNSKEKDNGIAYFVANGYSPKKILSEIDKCDVLCANCHRKIHYKNNKL